MGVLNYIMSAPATQHSIASSSESCSKLVASQIEEVGATKVERNENFPSTTSREHDLSSFFSEPEVYNCQTQEGLHFHRVFMSSPLAGMQLCTASPKSRFRDPCRMILSR